MSQPKRFRRNFTSIEQLPTELFVQIFGYLTGVDAVYAFSQLNSRFRSLLNNYVNILDFKSISKAKFDFITRYHDIHRWRSLRLSDDDHTPGQINHFCKQFLPVQYISQLESWELLSMQPTYAQELFFQYVSFNYLVSLTIGNICGETIVFFELPLLKRLVVTSCKHTKWMMNFHSLKYLEYTIVYNCHYDNVLRLPIRLTELKLYYEEYHDGNDLRTSLCQLSQLTKLSLYLKGSNSSLPDGKQWEELIQSSLPLLKTFQFCFPFNRHSTTLIDLKRIMDSFSTPFYLLEKRWFIRYDSSGDFPAMGVIYSLPFAFSEMPINTSSFETSMSTHNGQTKSDLYATVKTLVFNKTCQAPNEDFVTSNVVNVVLNAAITTNWLCLLTNLRHLTIENDIYISSTDFAHLLARTPQLRSLTIRIDQLERVTHEFTNDVVCNQLSKRIQSLRILDQYYLDEINLNIGILRHLRTLARIFGKRCEHLSLALAAHSNSVLPILWHMSQLRSFHIHCKTWNSKSEDNVKSWLQQQSTVFTDLDFVHITDENGYYIWLGDRP